jgi:hypothetical protein
MSAYGNPLVCVELQDSYPIYLLERDGKLRLLSWTNRVPFMDTQLDDSFLAACGIQAVS